jgi:hypothetical protein
MGLALHRLPLGPALGQQQQQQEGQGVVRALQGLAGIQQQQQQGLGCSSSHSLALHQGQHP